MPSNFSQVRSLQLRSSLGEEVLIEGLASRGLAQLRIMGLPDSWLKECKDKIQSLVAKTGGWEQLERVLIHILPEEEDKIGAHLELPIVLACLFALRGDDCPPATQALLETHHFIGALGLDGRLRETPASDALYANSDKHLVGPRSYRNVADLWADLRRGHLRETVRRVPGAALPAPPELPTEGRVYEKQWLVLAAAARLPALLCGTPGTGKSHLARWAQALAPLYALAPRHALPLEAPHSKTSLHHFLGLAHRGTSRPGVFENAHGGLLILDEFAELNRDVRETLRTVLDKKCVRRSEKARLFETPADFWLIATTNPCPCGLAKPVNVAACRCSPPAMSSYAQRISGPVFERFAVKLFIDRDEPYPPLPGVPPGGPALARVAAGLAPRNEGRVTELVPWIRATIPDLSYREHKNKAAIAEAFERLTGRPAADLLPYLQANREIERSLFRFRDLGSFGPPR